MKDKYDVIVIGAGLGGLICGDILSKEGLSVCVLERGYKLGGSIQSFAKNKTIFNTGLNYTESLGDGEILNRYFKFFGVMDKLKIKQLDENSFLNVSFEGDQTDYPFAQGHEHFIDKLSEHFPQSKQNLKKYINDLSEICNSFPLYNLDNGKYGLSNLDMLNIGSYNYLKTVDNNPKLQNVLAGMNPLYGAVESKTPLYVHALINYSFIKSSWRLVDGSSQLAARLAEEVKNNGGEVILNAKISKIGGENKEAKFIELANGDKIFAKHIISNIHPSVTLSMIDESLQKKFYTSRIQSLENTIGMFTIYIVLKKDKFPYLNYNINHFANTPWDVEYNINSWPQHYYMYTPASSKSEIWADGLVAMSYMRYEEVAKWGNSYIENRGEEYLEFKRKKAELLISEIEKKFPDIRQCIECYYSSTPLTYRDYTATPEGSSYGILKDYNDPLSTIITPRSRVKNVYFTGQNLNMHGILGVSIGAVLTCSEIIGYQYLIDKIRKT